MGELPSPSRYAEHQPGLLNHTQPTPLDESAESALVNGEEEPYTIKCICGFRDDDGNTVLCEQCNTWQHIECYYPQTNVPDVHTCADCSPRPLDVNGAAQRQRLLRDGLKGSDDRKVKRSGPKSHKKSKTKDLNNVPTHTNGWPAPDRQEFQAGPDRKRSSPRDQQPPAKRPKTSHRNTESFGSHSHGLQRPSSHRHRSGSNPTNAQSPSKSPLDLPLDYYSPEFIRVHQLNTNFKPAQTNLFLDIRVSNLLSNCLDDPSAFAAATNGRSAADCLKRSPQPIEERFVPIKKHVLEDTNQWFHGGHPRWPYVTVERDVLSNDLIGELKGQIGHCEEYKYEPTNHWDKLRHPDHFVFFHPILPIYIDGRSEGTDLRYVRRSCRPNVKVETIITGEREFRFCIMAVADLQAGDEITIGWNTELHQELQQCLSRVVSTSATDAEKEYLIGWTEGVLAHFGGCACGDPHGQECLMARFDRRLSIASPTANGPSSKTPKPRKSKKRSPSGTGQATNSRASSEAIQRGDVDDEMDDNRSTSRSSPSKTSRDGTPTAIGFLDSNGKELSERDRRKLLQSERLFEQLDQDRQQGQRRKKRSSGSSLNTSGTATSKQPGPYNSAGSNPTTPALPGRSRFIDNKNILDFDPSTSHYADSSRHSTAKSPSPVSYATSRQDIHRTPRPPYSNASTQTEPEEDIEAAIQSPLVRHKPHMSLTQRLLRRAHLAKCRSVEGVDVAVNSIPAASTAAGPQETNQAVVPLAAILPTEENNTSNEVVPKSEHGEQDFTKFVEPVASSELSTGPWSTNNTSPNSYQPSHLPIKPPPPPWPSADGKSSFDTASIPPKLEQARNPHRAAPLHVDLPPLPKFSPSASNESAIGATLGTLPSPSGQSPLSSEIVPYLGSAQLKSPSANGPNSITQPSPVKKKMSLSDYMNKKKVETPVIEKSQSQSHGPSAHFQTPAPLNGGTADTETQLTLESAPSSVGRTGASPDDVGISE